MLSRTTNNSPPAIPLVALDTCIRRSICESLVNIKSSSSSKTYFVVTCSRAAFRAADTPMSKSTDKYLSTTGESINRLFNTASLPSSTTCLLYTSPSPRDRTRSRMPSSA
eukprot:TRINITY_DN9557_c0_g2_i1.p2 TRINITY_DN9557_c0_g2~~TRINITY_DN9557_c0_g2_i1.p2  ORF type:complete len:110 (+),score=21.22 TRINITY_DN9557_c0_g2_i1:474-803(+)